jgi:ABC-type histidine transport system ATPase subunit
LRRAHADRFARRSRRARHRSSASAARRCRAASGSASRCEGAGPAAAAAHLDDATSALDPRVEQAILASLREAAAPSTVVVVAHRRATIELADEVVYVEHGRVIDRGSHAELLGRTPGYQRLVTAYERERAERAALELEGEDVA